MYLNMLVSLPLDGDLAREDVLRVRLEMGVQVFEERPRVFVAALVGQFRRC